MKTEIVKAYCPGRCGYATPDTMTVEELERAEWVPKGGRVWLIVDGTKRHSHTKPRSAKRPCSLLEPKMKVVPNAGAGPMPGEQRVVSGGFGKFGVSARVHETQREELLIAFPELVAANKGKSNPEFPLENGSVVEFKMQSDGGGHDYIVKVITGRYHGFVAHIAPATYHHFKMKEAA